MQEKRIGLALSGGGAKGAYQVGVIAALAEMGVNIHAISGTSIGALNGSPLACAKDLKLGARWVQDVWAEIATQSPLEFAPSTFTKLITTSAADAFKELLLKKNTTQLMSLIQDMLKSDGYFDNRPMQKCIERYVQPEDFDQALPFFVSVFPVSDQRKNVLRIAMAALKMSDTPQSEFIHIQNLPPSERIAAIMASASLPLFYAPQMVHGVLYSDGGQGSWYDASGNTPVTPLITYGCDTIIVSLLDEKSPWSKDKFPNTKIIELRPQKGLTCKSWRPGMLSFDKESIAAWIEQGYNETILRSALILQYTS